jgi:pectate lyase
MKSKQKNVALILFAGIFSFCMTSQVFAQPATAVADGFAAGTTGGGNASPITVTTAAALRSAVDGNTTSRVVIVNANINLGTSSLRVGSNKTIKGANANITITGCIQIIGVSNVIIQNLNLTNPSGVATGDGIEIHSSTRVFVTKCTFNNCADGSLDIVRGSDLITVSWCRFRYTSQTSHCFVNLIGNGDNAGDTDRGKLRITMHHNWWDNGCVERMPRVRFGRVHLYNNFYASNRTNYCVGVGNESQILLQNCYFENQPRPWANYSSSSAQGIIRWSGLHMVNSPTPTWAPNSSSVFTPPYSYSMDPASNVKSIVTNGAGNVISGGGTTPPPPSGGIVSGTFYRITPRHSGKAIDVENCGTANGTNVRQWSWLNNNCQKWRFTDIGNGYWRISPGHATDRALRTGGTGNGSNVMIQGYSDQTDRQWRLVDMGGGFYQVRARNSDRCLDINGFSTADGANVIVWDCNSNSMNQQFSFASQGTSLVSSAFLDDEDMEGAVEEKVMVYPNPVSGSQVTVQLSGLKGTSTIRLYDLSGRLVLEKVVTDVSSADLNVGLKSSIYILNVNNNGRVFVEKLTVK